MSYYFSKLLDASFDELDRMMGAAARMRTLITSHPQES